MRAKMQKQKSQKKYYQRQTSVEPVCANLKFNLGFDRFRMRGLEKVKVEFGLMFIAHNLNRLFKITIVTRNQRLMRYESPRKLKSSKQLSKHQNSKEKEEYWNFHSTFPLFVYLT